ncbi:hypothetical protein WA158_003114 [Blastocystis sp. Blastoise]
MDAKTFCQRIPKIEFHAHLHGSIRESTMEELCKRNYQDYSLYEKAKSLINSKRNLKECFALFDVIHDIIQEYDTVKRITKEVIDDFYAENTVYLELRSTPRKTTKIDEAQYIKAILESIEEEEEKYKNKMFVRLIISINRSEPIENAWNTVYMIDKMKTDSSNYLSKYIVGFELSGNPYAKQYQEFETVFNFIKEMSWHPCISLHVGEIPNREEEYIHTIQSSPLRIGHSLFYPSNIESLLSEYPVHIEVCPSSNIMTLSLPSLSSHPLLPFLLKNTIPFSINTDDASVFQTNISKEIYLFMNSFHISKDYIYTLERNCIQYIMDSSVKQDLTDIFDSFNY